MKIRGKKIRLIKKPRTVYSKLVDPYNRDKILMERSETLSRDTNYSYDLSRKNAQKPVIKKKKKKKNNKKD